MRRTIIIFVTCVFVVLILVSCSSPINTKDTFNIEEFFNLLEPAFFDEDSIPDYATEEEIEYLRAATYQNGLKSIGFKGGEHITLSGRLDSFSGSSQTNTAWLSITDRYQSHRLLVVGSFEDLGWATLLERHSNIKVAFDIIEDNDGCLSFGNGQIISPARIEYQPNCNPQDDGSIVIGRVIDIYDPNDFEGVSDAPSYSLYLARKHSNKYIIVKDEQGQEIGAFVSETKNQREIQIGDKIGLSGPIGNINIDGFPERYIAVLANGEGGYYIFF